MAESAPRAPKGAVGAFFVGALRTVGIAVALTVLLASCGGSSAEEVAPFAEIAVAGPDIKSDPSGTSAVLTVETSIDAICAVAYGVGQPVGSIATDREMEPEGHEEHRVVLSGLEPDTEYSYRLQGVGSDGRLYRSEVFAFRTPEATSSPFGPNLALVATVAGVSSEFSDSFGAGNALDGDLGTEWSSAGDGDEASITIDMGRDTDVTAVAFRTREMTDGSAITASFTLTVDDGAVLGPFEAGPDPIEVDLTGRLLRFDVAESTGGNTGAAEIEVYGRESG